MANQLQPLFADKLPRLLSAKANASQALANWTMISAEFAKRKITDEAQLACALSTVIVETAGTLEPLHEFGDAEYFTNMYWNNEPIRNALGNEKQGDAIIYAGAGFIQLTGRGNYARIGKEIGLDLIAHPELMLQVEPAAKALVAFWMGEGMAKTGQTSWPATWAMHLSEPEGKDLAMRARLLQNIRQCVNGGAHGLAQFITYTDWLLPVA